MIHELQSFAGAAAIFAGLAGLLCGIISIARQINWRRVPEHSWRHPFYVPTFLVFTLVPLELAWAAFGQIVNGFGIIHFTQGHLYNSTLKGMDYMLVQSGLLMAILLLGEQGYVHGLKPLLQKLKAAMKI